MENYNTIPNQTQALYNLATECCLRQMDRKCHCPKQWASAQCHECDCFIGNYINADIRQMQLFMREAHSRAFFLKEAGKLGVGNWLCIIFFALLIVGMVYLFIKDASYTKPTVAKPTVAKPTVAKPSTQVEKTTDQKIREALEKVAYDWDVKKVDVNGDGLINCIDAAVLFYKHYPDKKDVKIMSTFIKDPNGHLFIMVKGIDVEPQAFTKPRLAQYNMAYVWGSACYKPSYNKDETSIWRHYAK